MHELNAIPGYIMSNSRSELYLKTLSKQPIPLLLKDSFSGEKI